MKRKNMWISIGIFVFGAVLSCASFPALAQEDANGAPAITKGEGEGGKACCAYMGIYMEELTHRMRDKLKFPHETGVLITKIEPASPAEKAGLVEDDILYLFNGVNVEDAAQLASLVRERKPGEKASLVIYREGKEKKITITLGERASPAVITEDFGKYNEEMMRALKDVYKSAPGIYSKSFMMRGRLGMVLHDLNEDLAGYFNVKKGEGVLVLDVEDETPAAKAGMKSGDVIIAVNGASVSDAGDFMDAISEAGKGDTLSVDVVRKGVKKTIVLEIERGFGADRFYIAPFERSVIKKEPSFEQYRLRKNSDEAAKLREEMQALKERLKELEDRLDKAEKRE